MRLDSGPMMRTKVANLLSKERGGFRCTDVGQNPA